MNTPRWRYMLLDSEDRPLGLLDGVKGGSVSVAALSRLGGSGSLSLDHRTDIDWMRERVQITYENGTQSWPVATLLFTSPSMTQHSNRREYSVDLATKMSVLDEDAYDHSLSIPAGTPIIPRVEAMIREAGETRLAVTPSDAELRNPMVWEAGESKLTIINELLEAAGYWSLWVDGAGQFRVEPYVNPADRPVAHEFIQGPESLHEIGWSREQDLSGVPNKFVVVGEGDDEEPPLVGVAVNENPDSPFSFQARGRWITRTEEGVEAESQAVVDQLAQRRLFDAMDPVARISVKHAVLPLDPNQLVRFRDSGHDVLATIQNMKYDLRFDASVSAEWREVS